MKKSKFITSTIILIIGGFITKILGMVIKIVNTRLLGHDGIGIYMLILPTFLLFITLCQIGLPISISKIVAEDKHDNKKLIFSLIPVVLVYNILLMGILLLIAPFLSNVLLKNPDTYYPLISIGLTLPFICISGIIRGYFFGKEKMIPHTISHIVEQIVRLGILIFITKPLLQIGISQAVSGLVLVNIISELVSIAIFINYLPKKFKLKKEYLKPDFDNLKDLLDISLPTTGSRLIGTISYFFEPIIITFVLLKIGYSNNYILHEYGILSGYVMPLLLLPSFFTQAIASALLPVISNSYAKGYIGYTKSKVKQAILISLAIGILSTTVLMIFPKISMNLIYGTTLGSNYIRIMAPFFLLLYIQTPLTTTLQAINESKFSMISTLIGAILRTIILYVLSLFKIGMWGLVIASIINIFTVTFIQYKKIRKVLT